MPQYLFSNPKTQEVKEVIQGINDKHEYFENGVKWERVFTIPQANIDSKVPVTKDEFMTRTNTKRGTLGNMYDMARESSDKRTQAYGYDPQKMKHYNEYATKRCGKYPLEYYQSGYNTINPNPVKYTSKRKRKKKE